VEERAREVTRVHKTLEETQLTLGDVVSDVMGKAAQMILRAVVDGETDSVRGADGATGRVRANRETLERAVTGKATAPHRFLLGEHLTQSAQLDEAIRRISEELARRVTPPEPPTPQEEEHQTASSTAPSLTSTSPSAGSPDLRTWQQAVELIDPIPGISQRMARGDRGHEPTCCATKWQHTRREKRKDSWRENKHRKRELYQEQRMTQRRSLRREERAGCGVEATRTRPHPQMLAQEAGKPGIVTRRSGAVEGRAWRARRSRQERRQCACWARVCVSGGVSVGVAARGRV